MNEKTEISRPEIAQSALRTISILRDGLRQLEQSVASTLGDALADTVETLAHIGGRVIVTGVGKSGHIGSKIAATLASTGTPAFFVHPAEANHGDLGMIAKDDAILAISWSGETAELQGIVAYAKRFQIPLIALTSRIGLGPRCGYQAVFAKIDGGMSAWACTNNIDFDAIGCGRCHGNCIA